MQWLALLILSVLVILAISVESVLAFTFCAIISFILARNLLGSDAELDFARLFLTEDVKITKLRSGSRVIRKPFPQGLDGCRKIFIKNILRDFVVSWFENVGIGEKFILETRAVLEEATDSLHEKLTRTDVSSYTENLCIVLHKHLIAFQSAKNEEPLGYESAGVPLSQAYQSLKGKYHVEKNEEAQYLRTVVDLLLHKLIKKQTLDCSTGRFILREILAISLFLPLVHSLSDPDFLNTSIINVFGVEKQGQVTPCGQAFNEVDGFPKSRLMECLEKNSSADFNDPGAFSSSDCEPSVKYKFKHTTVIEQDHEEIVEISMETDHDSQNKVKVVTDEVDGLKQIKMKLKTAGNHQNLVKDSEKQNTFDKEPKHTESSIKVPNKCSGKSDHGHGDEKVSVVKDSGSKLKAIFGGKIHPGAFLFHRNLKQSNESLGIKQSTGTVLTSTLPGSGSNEGSFTIQSNSHQKNESMFNNVSQSLVLADSCSPIEKDETSIETEEQSNQLITNGYPGSFSSMPGTKGSISSSFEEIDIFESSSCDNDVTSSGQKREEIEDEAMDVINFSQTDDISECEDNLSHKESESCVTKIGSTGKDSQTYTILSSSAEDWDTDAFEAELEDDQFVEIGNDFSKAIPHQTPSDLEGKQRDSLPSLGEVSTPRMDNPCLLISIPSTELVADGSWEPHKGKYTTYHIQYSNKLWPQTELQEDIEKSSLSTENERIIKRRYREFMELHHRLSVGPYASCLKDVPKPNRKFNSPFFRLDQDVVEGRQHLLESYLKALVSQPQILNCDDFKGFLGIGDKSHTTFRRQIIVPAVPRIDKKLQKKVTKIIGHIKTAFEVTGPVDGDKEEDYDDISQVLGEDKTLQDDIRTFLTCSGGCRLQHSCCYSGKCFQSFVQKIRQKQDSSEVENLVGEQGQQPQEEVAQKSAPCRYEHTKNSEEYKTSLKFSLPKRKVLETKSKSSVGSKLIKDHQRTYPLTENVLDLTCEILKDQESWVCMEPVQKAATAMFGFLLEWWFESLARELITEEQWHHYLTLLLETIWPGGKLMNSNQEERTKEEKEKTKEEAVQTLSNFFGDVIQAAVGSDAIKTSARNIIESLQCPEINRQLLFEILEVTLAEVFPEIIHEQELYLSTIHC